MDKYSKGGLNARTGGLKRGKNVQMPSERAGVAMVYKAYDRMSFALVMEATHEIREGDRATNP